MIIFKNSFVTLDYDPALDILYVDMPTVNSLNMSEVRKTLGVIVEHVRNYDVKKLLVYARKTEVEVTESAYAEMIGEFSQNLMSTRLQKVARIATSSEVRESVVKKVYQAEKLPLEFQTFTQVAPAVVWLSS